MAFTDRLIAGLADRYSIERELGQGGMAYVYLGQDLKHRRPVAIKVLRPDLAAALGAERFLREIEVTARLTHPRIVPIFDSGRVGDLLYYVMPFVAGESLRARMQREGQMPVADAVALTVAVAAALDYAHRQGIVHRDIKPENILLPEGEALVADFGIARTLAAALEPADGGRLTETGFAIGTPIYMSPEQAASELGVDGRSDQFALACVLFEMLVGEPPFRGPNSQAIAARRAVEPMPSIRTVRPGVPAAVEHVIRQALEKAPADRFPTAQAFADALVKAAAEPVTAPTAAATPGLHPRRQRRSLLAVTAVLAAGLLVAAGVASRLLSRRSVGAVPPAGVAGGLAVLAFDNLTAVPADSTLATGLAAELAGELRQVRGLRVAAPASAFSYRGSAASLDSVARALGVRRLVTGALRRSSDSLRIDVQLFDAAGGKRERIGRYEARGMVSFAQQDSIVLAIVTALQGQVAEGTRRRVIHHGTTDLAAQSAYFRARAILATRINLGDALAAFDEAIARDSLYAKAWAGRADAYAFMGIMCCSLEPADALPLARAAVLRALELDPTSAEAHTSLAIILQQGDKNIRAAQAQLDTALALDSTYAEAHLFAAWTHIARHEPAAAIAEAETALRMSPRSPIISMRLGTMYYLARRYDEAVAQLRRTVELDPAAPLGHTALAGVYAVMGRCAEALAETAVAAGKGGAFSVAPGYVLAVCGRAPEARRELAGMLAQSRAGTYVAARLIADVYLGLGDRERFLSWFERAFDAHEPLFPTDPIYDPVRDDPRFVALEARWVK